MSEAPAAFQGSYCDLKFIRTRKVAQVVIEIPLEYAGEFIKAFGAPDPSAEIPVAIARMDYSAKPEPEPKALPAPDKRSWSDLRPSQQAGIRCGDEAFQKFLRDTRPVQWRTASFDDANNTDAMRAAECVRDWCSIRSRSELDRDSDAADAWFQLNADFDVWMGRAG